MAEDSQNSDHSTIYTPDGNYGSPPVSPHLSDFAQFSDIEDSEDGTISSGDTCSDVEEPPNQRRKVGEDIEHPAILIDSDDEEPASGTKPKTILDYFKPKSTTASSSVFTFLMNSSQ